MLSIKLRHFVAALAILALGSCFAERDPRAFGSGTGGSGLVPTAGEGGIGDGAGGEVEPTPVVRCSQAHTMERLPARGPVMSTDIVESTRRVYVTSIFDLFDNQCGACHVANALGDPPFQIRSAAEFPTKMADSYEDVFARIESTDEDEFMPPPANGGRPFDDRPEGDLVRELDTLLRLWVKNGMPRDLFEVQVEGVDQSPYLLQPRVGEALTNLGNCVPDKILYAAPKSDELDEMFASLERLPPGEGTSAERIGLPMRLEQTDLFTFDSKRLAEHGVVAFAPEYPLWSDGSGKLRHVRVPKGTSIRYNPETREFDIPPNTRFYKTFLKPVYDINGQPSYRKMETRLIVSRPAVQRADGTWEQKALFGSYAWSQDEIEAVLVTDTFRNGEPFADRISFYELDEFAAEAARDEVHAREASLGIDLDENYEVQSRGLIRHYAIPSSERCIQCHMGSPTRSFVLGMTPLQINRVPDGESGAIEATGPDELSQLRRLVGYGVITGIDPDEMFRLEDSQGDRKPRNEYELKAQAYMFGNCAHCHNPNGFPTSRAPELRELLNFWPSATGGIFQFPLERQSPRILRGLDRDVPMPYITPSLRDYIPLTESRWTPKHSIDGVFLDFFEAPWRSLIFRNTSTPFTYSDDFVFFPHMPMNTAGHDCRASRILGDWMVSIPGKRKHPELSEDAVVIPDGPPNQQELVDREPQPYVEVKEGDPDYPEAIRNVERRLGRWHDDDIYAICPDEFMTQVDGRSDILDPYVVSGQHIIPEDGEARVEGRPVDGVPDYPHWVSTDLTEVRGPWNPRRSDWEKVIVDQAFPTLDPTNARYTILKEEQDAEIEVVRLLQTTSLTTAFRSFASQAIPFGLWQEKAECDFSGIEQVKDFTGESRPLWMDQVPARNSPNAHVYSLSPGEAVYREICINCHGPQADSRGALAENLQVYTGGQARVANFRTGLFGPIDMAGANRERVFGDVAAASGLTPDDWGSRYMGWMALGGTEVEIPKPILDTVASTKVLGESRRGFVVNASANMLTVAEEYCRFVLPMNDNVDVRYDSLSGLFTTRLPLIRKNGDAELWTSLCSQGHEIPLRVVEFNKRDNEQSFLALAATRSFYDLPTTYPSTAPIGNHRGEIVQGLGADNLVPWCIKRPSDPEEAALAEQYVAATPLGGHPLPFCPNGIPSGDPWPIAKLEEWATRGALNAGFAVFLFLDRVSKGAVPKSNQECELLQ